MSVNSNDWLVSVQGAHDVRDATLARRADINAITDAFGRAHPAFRSFLESITAEESQARFDDYWERYERAMNGDWAALAERLRINGVIYARLGATLTDWQALTQCNGEPVVAELVSRHANDPARLTTALMALQKFYDYAYTVFVESFQVASQATLHHSDALFRLVSIGIVIVDAQGFLREANEAFLTLYGLTPTTLQTRDLASLFEPGTFALYRARHLAEAERSGHVRYDAIHLDAAGRPFPVRLEGVRLSAPGQPQLWGLCLTDLTDRARVETLSRRSAELETENERERAANRVKSEFLANMSHELRTPLNSIIGFSQLLELGEVGALSTQQLDFVHDIHTSGQHLLGLINDVLDLSKVESGKMEFFPERVDVDALVRAVAHALRSSSLTIDVEVEPTCSHAWLDPIRLKQVLYNYLSNAIKFSPPGARVVVRVAAWPDDQLRFEVVDRGHGIAPEDLSRLFLMFEQLDGGRNKRHAGTGLGLALTRRLVEAQGGAVGVESKIGEGSTFYAILPRGAATTG